MLTEQRIREAARKQALREANARKIRELKAKGKSNVAIARELGLNESTVRSVLQSGYVEDQRRPGYDFQESAYPKQYAPRPSGVVVN